MPRPLAITPEQIKELMTWISAGNTEKDSIAAAGISESTYFEYKKIGALAQKKIEAGEEISTKEKTCVDLYNTVKQALIKAKVTAVGYVRAAMPTNWQAAMTYLERRYPDEYGRRDRMIHGGAVGILKMTPEDEAAYRENFALFFPDLSNKMEGE